MSLFKTYIHRLFFSTRFFYIAVIAAVSAAAVFYFFFGSAQHKSQSPAERERTEAVEGNALVFRLSEPMSPNHPGAEASAYFASLVDKKSNGKIRIKVYYNGELGSQEEVIDQLQFGGIAMGRLNILEIAERVPSPSVSI